MAITVTCDCGRVCRFRPDAAGKKIRCPDCQGVINVPKRRPRPNGRQRAAGGRPKRQPIEDYDAPIEDYGAPDDEHDHVEAAIERVIREMGSYRHRQCGARTRVPDDVLELAALDPWLFSLGSIECSGCGGARSDDAVLDDGRTVREGFAELKRSVPTSGVIIRFIVIPLLAGMLGAVAGAVVGTVKGGGHTLMLTVFGFGMGVVGGTYVNRYLFKILRRMGAFW